MNQHNIRVATYNVHFGLDTKAISEVFKKNKNLSQADIIFFQEIEHHHAEAMPRAEAIAKELGMHFSYAPARPVKDLGTHGIATFSRYPLDDNKILKLPKYNMVFHSYQRIALISTAVIAGKRVTLCNIHLDSRLNPTQRIAQLDFALQRLIKNHPGPIIFGGDLNTIPMLLAGKMVPVFYANQFKLIHEHMSDRGFVYSCEKKRYTMKKGLLRMSLDHIYTNTLPIVSSGVEQKVFASDHKPLWADVEVNTVL